MVADAAQHKSTDYELKAAIHNQGPNDKLFSSPLQVYEAVQPLSSKIGLCMDIGHTFRMQEDLLAARPALQRAFQRSRFRSR